ncbi:hypothetical protein ABIC99_003985 [Sphaerotilus sulfidivorans]|uniref:HlyD family efflux transporter periplasmic adaptor subunit n=1 Tax=Sphaerotilus sulfidivorans TaxID=639200 RepID=A0ABV2ITF8_9BURK|nr:HlyD family efflux transporter periplasmic adaptor subunit [Sphaerotilus sulfidivorans]NZD48092.1 HlyD family efflux transporter periplasmic adaptor subunit [Sphaerotilus sulfidivorans]
MHVDKVLAPRALFILKNERSQAELDQAIAVHHSEYLERFGSAGAISATLRAENAARITTTELLKKKIEERHVALQDSYAKSATDVVNATMSTSRHEGDKAPVTRTYSAPLLLSTAAYSISINGGGMPATMTHSVPVVDVSPKLFRAGGFQPISEELSHNAATGSIGGPLTQVSEVHQRPVVTTNSLAEFVHPRLEEDIESANAISQLDSEQAELSVRKPRLQNLEQILSNEDKSLRAEVKKRQAALIDSYLVCPIDGIVTAIYKDVGEYVQAGEPVLRVEDDTELLIVGFIQCKGIIELGEPVHLDVKNVFESGASLSLAGNIVALRGHESDDDEWDIVIHVKNQQGQQLRQKDGKTRIVRLPINFQFDRLETRISLG